MTTNVPDSSTIHFDKYENITYFNFEHDEAQIFNVTKSDFPLNAYTYLSSFKLYMSDVGLLTSINAK